MFPCLLTIRFRNYSTETQITLFYDSSIGAFFSTTANAPHTILRLKDGMDTSLPSTNATAVSNLFRLSALLDDDRFATLAKESVDAFEAEMLQHPWLFPGLLGGVVTARLGVPREAAAAEVRYRATREKA